MVSQAASISAWWQVLLWPSMVAALIVDRHRSARRSAAVRNTEARASQGQDAQSRRASMAACTAASTSAGPAR